MKKSPNQNPENFGRVMRELGHLLWPRDFPRFKLIVSVSFFLIMLRKLLAIGSPFIMKAIVDSIDFGPQPLVVMVPLLLLLAFVTTMILETVVTNVEPLFSYPVVQHAERSLAKMAFEHIHSLSLRFHLDRKTGAITRALHRGVEAIDELIANAIFILPVALEALLVAAILSLGFSLWLGLILTITLFLFFYFTYRITIARNKVRAEANKADNEAGNRVVDSLINYETVKYFGNETKESARFMQSFATYQRATRRLTISLGLMNIGQMTILFTGLGLALMVVITRIGGGHMTLGDLVLVSSLFFNLNRPLFFLGTSYRHITQSVVDLNNLFDLVEEAEEVVDLPDAQDLNITQGEITFQDVEFSYSPEREILKGVSFSVPPGKKVAIVGGSGAGKSTIARLLFRFYDVGGGQILIDGQPIRRTTQTSLRAAIGMVPQDTVLFNESVGFNIGYGREGATQEEIEQAASGAQIHQFIKALPEGYDTLVGERGLKLSGGEKQRVAIARTLLKNPPLLILDEATSALDSHTEADIQEALNAAARGRSTVVIAHRLSTVVDADEILVMEQGEIVERGHHKDLVKQDGPYAALWERQKKAQVLEQDSHPV